jgi:acetolactate synthase-1/2/3 large subunit
MAICEHGGDWVAEALVAQGVQFVFTLTGGHIAPILVGAKQRGIRVIDTRHEATAVFAADAVARLTGTAGVAIVTAGPGVTNTITALKNAQMAQSPVVLIGGAAATALRGRGALQDIDQIALVRSIVKWHRRVGRVQDLTATIAEAFRVAASGVPGPVFVEIPVDLLYGEALVREWYGIKSGGSHSLVGKAVQNFMKLHVARLFAGAKTQQVRPIIAPALPQMDATSAQQAATALGQAQRPVILVGSQAVLDVAQVGELAIALERIGAPVYLSGMARGLLGAEHRLQMRHKRREALREADLVVLAGVPCDFRLDYGNHIPRHASYIAANRSREDLFRNRRPQIAALGDAGLFLRMLATQMPPLERWEAWHTQLRARDIAREAEITQQTDQRFAAINPLQVCADIAARGRPNAIYVVDGGDFVATAAYILRPPAPLTWLDPGPFGTLGVGAGFALGAKLCRPDAEVWLIYGDGSAGYGLAEFDTLTRHGIGLIAVVGNDGGWTQIARDQVPMLGDDVGTTLVQSDYDRVVAGLGAFGVRVDDPELLGDALDSAQQAAMSGQPALVNVIIGKSAFRKGSLSM